MVFLPLHLRVSLLNGLVFLVGVVVFAVSPATVSQSVLLRELVVLGVGLALIIAVNALLLRGMLLPVDHLVERLRTLDLRRPGARLPIEGRGTTATLARGYNELLDRLDEERRERTLHMLQGQEIERQRIGQELHDEVGQSLTALLLGLRRVAPHVAADGAQDLAFLQDLTRASLDEVRRIARALRPSALDDLGLHGSLGALVADFTATTGIPVHRSFSLGVTGVPREVEVVLYRVTQEALTNVARHAQASSVQLSLTRVGESIVLTVGDDGVGLPDGVEGNGIQGMRERALLIGSALSVSRRPAGGTEVRLTVPTPGRGAGDG